MHVALREVIDFIEKGKPRSGRCVCLDRNAAAGAFKIQDRCARPDAGPVYVIDKSFMHDLRGRDGDEAQNTEHGTQNTDSRQKETEEIFLCL